MNEFVQKSVRYIVKLIHRAQVTLSSGTGISHSAGQGSRKETATVCFCGGAGGARERSLQREDRGTEIPNHSSFLLIGST